MPDRNHPRRRRVRPSGHICILRPAPHAIPSENRSTSSRVLLGLVLFHVVLLAAVIGFNFIESGPVEHSGKSVDLLGTATLVVAGLVVGAEVLLRRARRRLQEERLRRLKLAARREPPLERMLVSG